MNNKGTKTVLAIGDLHAPFEHKDTLVFLKWVVSKYKPNEIVCMGDEIDAHALSDYDHDPDGLSPGHELERAIDHLQDFYKMFPNVKVCTSNHTARPYRKAYKHGLPKRLIKDYRDFLDAPKGWQWADRWVIDGVNYEHGEGVSGREGAIKAAIGNMNSTVVGHIHSFAGIQYLANPKHLIFGFNVGCLIDHKAYAFAYGKTMKVKPVIGVGLVIKGVPLFVPMILDRHGRWVGAKK